MEDALDAILGSVTADRTCWPYVKDKFLYDVYLDWRKEEGTITEIDLVRTGITMAMFSSGDAYNQHCIRVGEARKTAVTVTITVLR